MESIKPKPPIEPIQRYRRLMYSTLGKTAKWCGVGILSPDFQFNTMTGLSTTLLLLDLGLCSYTMTCFSQEVALKAFTNFAFTIQGLCKLAFYLINGNKVREFSQYLIVLYEANRSANDPFYHVLDKCCRMFERLIKIGIALYAMVVISFVANTTMLFFVTGEMVPVFEIYIPGVDITTPRGFLISSALHAANAAYAFLGSVWADYTFMLICVHLWPMCIIFERYTASLDDDLLAEGGRTNWTIQMELKLRNIVLVHQEIVDFSRTVFTQFYIFSSLELYNNQYLMIVLLYCMLTINWPPGDLFLLLLTGRLLIYCVLGTIIDSLNSRIYSAMILSQWYRMPIECRYRFGMMLLRAQRSSTLSAGLVTLNLDTFVNVMHTVYSATMLMMQTL